MSDKRRTSHEGMGMKNKKQTRYKKEDFLPSQNYYSVKKSYDEKIHEDIGHNFWSGVKYVITLSFMLWWLPVIGQMVAGYVGGRRAGSPIRGVIASLIPIDILLAFHIFVSSGYLANPEQIYGAPGAISSIVATNIPFFFPYLDFSFLYLANIFHSFEAVLAFQPSAYFIVVVFAMLGGLMADQNRKEIAAMARNYTTQHHHYQPPPAAPMPQAIPSQYVMISRYPYKDAGNVQSEARPKARKKPKKAKKSNEAVAAAPKKEKAVAIMPKNLDTL